MNVHLLKHIPDCVRDWGPLWAYSCFSFESMNGHLKRHFHGARCMNVQVCRCAFTSNKFYVHMLTYLNAAGIFIYHDANSAKKCYGNFAKHVCKNIPHCVILYARINALSSTSDSSSLTVL